MGGCSIGGFRPDGRRFLLMNIFGGGWGGRPHEDPPVGGPLGRARGNQRHLLSEDCDRRWQPVGDAYLLTRAGPATYVGKSSWVVDDVSGIEAAHPAARANARVDASQLPM